MNYLFGSTTTSTTTDSNSPKTKYGPVYKSSNDVDYHAFAKENVQVLLDRHTGKDQVTTWQLVDNQNGVKIWRGEVVGCSWSPFRVSRRVTASKLAIERALLDPVLLLQLDDMTDEVRVLKQLSDDGRLTLRHIATKGIFPIAARDAFVVTYSHTLEDGTVVIASRSICLEDVQVIDGHVLVHNFISGYIIQETTDQNGNAVCDVTLIAHADLSGYVPAAITNMIGTSATAKILDNLQKTVSQNGVQ